MSKRTSRPPVKRPAVKRPPPEPPPIAPENPARATEPAGGPARPIAWWHALLSSPAFAYVTILVLQLKVVWGLWLYKDLETGDTTYYFMNAKLWHARGIDVFPWSPLYTTFYGWMFNISNDAYIATIAHRLIIVLSLAVLVLALMRRLLAAPVAWMMAAWWVVLPINFDALYSVHLFLMIPLLLAYLVISYWPGSPGRGICAGILLLTAVLMRNEIALAFVLFAAVCLIYEIRVRLAGSPWKRAWHYLVPSLLAAGICLFFYVNAYDRPATRRVFENKHTLNICQVYAAGYGQRHPEWGKNPWIECEGLMQATFGKRQPALTEAMIANPAALLEHFWWNISLLPNGLEVLLFNAMAGNVNPDYAPVQVDKVPVVAASFLLIAVWIWGIYRVQHRWTYWRASLNAIQVWTWTALFSVAAVTIFVIVTQRPRPSYLFPVSVLLMALTGVWIQAILGPAVLSWQNVWAPVVVVVVLMVTPCYYHAAAHQSPRTLLRYYRLLNPFADRMGPRVVLVIPSFGAELCNTIAAPLTPSCRALDFSSIRSQSPGAPLSDVLTANKATLLFVDEKMLQDAWMADFVTNAKVNGWQTIGLRQMPGDRWMLFERAGI